MDHQTEKVAMTSTCFQYVFTMVSIEVYGTLQSPLSIQFVSAKNLINSLGSEHPCFLWDYAKIKSVGVMTMRFKTTVLLVKMKHSDCS